MKDADLRAALLQQFYEDRHEKGYTAVPIESIESQANDIIQYNICTQLSEHGLIDWKPLVGGAQGMGRISARGVDVIEGNVAPPIAISIDSSVSVSGSSNVQVGSQNSQTIIIDADKIVAAIDGSTASDNEKTEAKSLLRSFFDNPLIKLGLVKMGILKA